MRKSRIKSIISCSLAVGMLSSMSTSVFAEDIKDKVYKNPVIEREDVSLNEAIQDNSFQIEEAQQSKQAITQRNAYWKVWDVGTHNVKYGTEG